MGAPFVGPYRILGFADEKGGGPLDGVLSAEPLQPIGCNDSARHIWVSESHQIGTCRHISKAGIGRSSDCRATGRNRALGATGRGSDYSSNGRASSDGAEGGVSGGRKLKRLGSTLISNLLNTLLILTNKKPAKYIYSKKLFFTEVRNRHVLFDARQNSG